ncbi:PEP-CTERM-box response regulator transcription factor [Rhodospirillum rubrum]|uniref:PEP-CTERM-box response regulator transcription factor n=1 Tax=Rhodospirillum rubrum TaxID=1085 RepID=UPI00190758CC|nr:PEP-CTERM-box response regulator transcription factor [Rhodospirillum rubrum]MBK1665960.1 PEP-CTERM-box response regulator transcription factor [Rhodospirillum rubrum]MBK1678440.1 PEP-CTERM-box response regulator transcription factor [Rhodospirillum rubrum]
MTEPLPRLLIVEDDVGVQSQLKWSFSDDWLVDVASDRTKALEIAARTPPTIVILDLGLPPEPNGAGEGLATLEGLISLDPLTKVIVSSGNEDHRHALSAIRLGAYDFYPKPVDIEHLRLITARAAHLRRLEEENRQLARAGHAGPLANVIGESAAIQAVCQMVRRVASTTVNVLLLGESGTGKEVFAHSLHQLSGRAGQPFVAINCAAIPEQLLESELFGHEKGAFTGALRQTTGKIQQANGGTLFLDEIGDMPPPLQAKLLRFLQSRVIERVGGRQSLEVDVRIVSATNRDLGALIEKGEFREDLYYRLDEVKIALPPLRDRIEDAPLLAQYFLDSFAASMGRKVTGFSSDAQIALSAHPWPGNVRELENRVKRAVVLAEGRLVTAQDLDLVGGTIRTLRQIRRQADYQAVTTALSLAGNNLSTTAKLLGISRPTLYDLIETHNIHV